MFKSILTQHTHIEKQLERVTGESVEALPKPIRAIHNPTICPADLLPWLAWERSVDYWRDDWSEQIKRDVIAASVAVHRKKGTLAALKQAIDATGLKTKIVIAKESPYYVPHSFFVQVNTANTTLTPTDAADIRYQIDHVKPARCTYTLGFSESVAVTLKSSARLVSRGAESRTPRAFNYVEAAQLDTKRSAVLRAHLKEAA